MVFWDILVRCGTIGVSLVYLCISATGPWRVPGQLYKPFKGPLPIKYLFARNRRGFPTRRYWFTPSPPPKQINDLFYFRYLGFLALNCDLPLPYIWMAKAQRFYKLLLTITRVSNKMQLFEHCLLWNMSKSAKANLPTCLCREPKKEAGGSTVTSTFFKCCEAGYIKIQLHLLFHLPISAHPHLKSVKQTPIVVAYERDHRKYIHSLVLTTVQEKKPKHFHCSNSLNWLRFDSELTKSLFPEEWPDWKKYLA